MQEKTEKKPSVFRATFRTIKAVFKTPTPDYEYQFPERKMLHEKSPPHVQSVNECLDKEGVALGKEHIPHFERGQEIRTHKGSGYAHEQKRRWKMIKNEDKIARSFEEEANKEEAKGPEADQKKIAYARAGFWAHSSNKYVTAATNPYVSHEDDLGIGATHEWLTMQQEIKLATPSNI